MSESQKPLIFDELMMYIMSFFNFTMNLLVVNLLSCLLFLPLVTIDLAMSPVSLPGQCLLQTCKICFYFLGTIM